MKKHFSKNLIMIEEQEKFQSSNTCWICEELIDHENVRDHRHITLKFRGAGQATIECGFTLKRVRDMTRTYSQMHRTDKYSEHSSIIWPVWPNG